MCATRTSVENMENFCFINAIHCTRKNTSRKTNCVYNVLVRVDGTRVVFEGNRVGFYEDEIIKNEIITAEVEKEVINFLMRRARQNRCNETVLQVTCLMN